MDFKVAGTREGVTALQMDIKITGVTREIMQQALEQARQGRIHILDEMEKVLGDPRTELSRYAPRLYTIQIPVSKIRDVIGPGGKVIRSIQEETGVEITVEDDGTIIIASPDEPAARHAIELIERLTEVPEIGRVYTGPVRRVESYGAFVELMPGTDGLLHVSELAPFRVENVSDLIKEGDEVTVKVINIDDSGKIRLSRKAVVLEDPNYDAAAEAAAIGATVGAGGGGEGGGGRGGDRGGRGGDRGGRGGDRGGRGGRGGDRGGRGGSSGGSSGGSGGGGRW
jgi:polyribonucleotide nucleotidyltransferase